MPEHRNSLQPGYQLHWYVIKRILGQGGFGITYLAEDTNLDQEVAIKEYLPVELAVREQDDSIHPVSGEHGEQFSWGLDRFMSEARTLAQFKHPNIVRVLTVFPENNTAYMVMEYEHGKAMHELLKEKKTLAEDELKSIYLPILDGLEKVHETGFIHRDIKPPNIFIRSDGTPVLLDFGSARQSLGELTRTLTSMVSPGFAPFEQYISKSDKQGPWTDIYGLGATLYRSVTGRSPAEAMDRSEALLHTSRDSFVGAAEIKPKGYTMGFLKAIDHALAFKGEDRPQSISEWRAELSAEFAEPDSSTATAEPPLSASVPEKITIMADVDNSEEDTIVIGKTKTRSWYRKPLKIIAVGFGVLLLLAILDDNNKKASEKSDSNLIENVDSVANLKDTTEEGISEPPVVKQNDLRDEPGDLDAVSGGSVFDERDRQKLERLKKILARSPDNEQAKREVRKIFTKYEKKARKAFKDESYNEVTLFIQEMLELAPDNKKLLELQKSLNQRNSTN